MENVQTAIREYLFCIIQGEDQLGLRSLLTLHPVSLASHWLLPQRTCQAVGGNMTLAVPCCSAMGAIHLSILLIDDLIDHEEHFPEAGILPDQKANLAAALQALCFEAILQAPFSDAKKCAAQFVLARMITSISKGQYLDAQGIATEDGYWQVVRAKSSPFFRAAFQLGGIAGNAGETTLEALQQIGDLYGEMVQIEDDLADCLEGEAIAVYSLPYLFAHTVEHPHRARFEELQQVPLTPASIQEMRNIFWQCGAISYCTYHLITRFNLAADLLAQAALPDPQSIQVILQRAIRPVEALLQRIALKAQGNDELVKMDEQVYNFAQMF